MYLDVINDGERNRWNNYGGLNPPDNVFFITGISQTRK